ncbi:hypothetical protein [Vreelandella titanicae]|uniref:hypothetical protein n=1 Tax=Vreelandella titanicae TaxID=664683 RepID=UPI003FD73D44
MSSLIFYTDDTQALVATDTLVVDPSGNPIHFCSKAIYLPHLRTIIAGTGIGGFANNWANDVNNDFVVSGIDNLDFHTPSSLRAKWEKLTKEHDFPEDATTTVYQIGISENSQQISSYAYRSTSNFESEKLSHGLKMKPECQPVGNDLSLLEALRPMMEEQRRIQEQVDERARLYIGGQCTYMHLTKDACTTATLFNFEDYEDQLSHIFDSI